MKKCHRMGNIAVVNQVYDCRLFSKEAKWQVEAKDEEHRTS